jgi:SgrR family transcriptional regulator
MHVYEVYEDLRKYFQAKEEVPILVTLETVANVLACSKRNANFALKRLVEKEWISWEPGKGRGNHSVIVFYLSIQEMYVQVAMEKIKTGDISGSLKIIEKQVSDVSLKEQYFQWLHHSYGVQTGEMHHDIVDTLRIPIIKDIGSLDPILTTCGIETHLVKHIFDTLVVFDSKHNRIESGLAHFWESKDDVEWTLYIRKGVFFHNGYECNSKDVLYTIQRLRNEDTIYSWMVRDIEHIETLNNLAIRMKLSKPNRYFLHFLAAHPMSIVQRNSSLRQSLLPIGTGSFKVAQNDTHILTLQANSYHYNGRPFLDKIELWKTVGNKTSLNGVRPDVFQLEKLVLHNPEPKKMKWNSASQLENGCKLLTFNLNMDGPQQSILFRKAMSILLQREELVKLIDWEDYSPAYSLLPRERGGKAGFQSDYKNIAKQYVEESGYAGESIVLSCSVYHEKDALLLQKVCQEIGINLDLRFIQKKTDAPYPEIKNAQIILFECLFDHDLTFSLLDVYMTEEGFIRRNLSPQFESFIEHKISSHIHHSNSKNDLKNVLDEVEQLLLEDYAIICLYRRNKTIQYSVGLAGIQIEPLGWVNFAKIWCLG